MWRDAADYVDSLGLDAYLVGGAVRDELLGRSSSKDQDFVVPGVGHAELRVALEPHGRIEDLEVAGQLVVVRLFPRDRAARALAPAGIEFAPPRTERSTGPGRHDFDIVADASISVADDMARRDFTVNAIAKRLATGEFLDPFDGRGDLERKILRTVSPRSFAEDPLRLIRGLRLVSELDLDPDGATVEQMRVHAKQVRLVSGERVGGGLAADGLGELSRLLMGSHPAKALRIARDTGVLVELIPEFEPAVGYEQESRWHALTLDEHTFHAVQAGADAGAPLQVRLALLFHDLGKPDSAWRGDDGRLHFYANPKLGKRAHEEIGADIVSAATSRLRYPTRLRTRVRRIVRHHMFSPPRRDVDVRARKFLAHHGDALAFDLVEHKRADLLGKEPELTDERLQEVRELDAFREVLDRERASPHRVGDLALDGSDLIEIGYRPGPELGRALDALLEDVIGDPTRNTREWLTERARTILAS